MNGAEVIFNPSATAKGLSDHLWTLEQPAAAVANMRLYRRQQPRRLGSAVEHRPVLRLQLLLSIRAARSSTRGRTTGTRWSPPSSTSP